jgi:hypothetical protein
MRSLRVALVSLCLALCFLTGCEVDKETVQQNPSCPSGCICTMLPDGGAIVDCEGGGGGELLQVQ